MLTNNQIVLNGLAFATLILVLAVLRLMMHVQELVDIAQVKQIRLNINSI